MIPILYESTELSFQSNGLGRLRDCISCKVTEERNGIYECDFQYPITGAHYDQITAGRIIAVRCDSDNRIQPFDIVSYSKPINGIVDFHAVHVSYRLSKLVTYSTGINSLSAALTILRAAVPSNPFTFDTDIDSTAYMAAFDGVPRSVRSLIGGIEGSILDTYGGELKFDQFSVYLYKNRGELKNVTIRYGNNMKDYNDDTDYSETYTSCVPYWIGTGEDGNETVVKGGRVVSSLPSFNGRENCVPLDMTDKFEEIPTSDDLNSAAASYMTANNVNLPEQNIKVDFVLLQNTTEYAKYADLLDCRLCDTVKMVFPAYGMEGTLKIVKTEYDVLGERYETMELGTLATTLSEALGVEKPQPFEQPVPIIIPEIPEIPEIPDEVVPVTGSVTVAEGWENYSETSLPLLVKYGSVVGFTWVCKPSEDTSLDRTGSQICTLPSGYRPTKGVYAVGQSSKTSLCLIEVHTDGAVYLSRLRDMESSNGSYSTATSSMWFPVNVTFVIS